MSRPALICAQLAAKPEVICDHTDKNERSQRAERIISEVMPECPSAQGHANTRGEQQ
jgi:hypothetical protein